VKTRVNPKRSMGEAEIDRKARNRRKREAKRVDVGKMHILTHLVLRVRKKMTRDQRIRLDVAQGVRPSGCMYHNGKHFVILVRG